MAALEVLVPPRKANEVTFKGTYAVVKLNVTRAAAAALKYTMVDQSQQGLLRYSRRVIVATKLWALVQVECGDDPSGTTI